MENKAVLSVIVDNQANVLSRVVNLFGRRGFNIDSLTVSATNDPKLSRITVVAAGDEHSLAQVMVQTEKLENVRMVYRLTEGDSLFRELLLVKMTATKEERSEILEIANVYRARILNLDKSCIVAELTGSPSKIDGFMSMIDSYNIVEVCRTGITAMKRGWEEKEN